MTNISTIEDVLENILGLVLGAPAGQFELATPGNGGGNPNPGKSNLNATFRPANVLSGGKWLIAQSSTLRHLGSWHPEYDKDAVTFYKWQEIGVATKRITRLTVWVGLTNRDNTQGQKNNSDDPSGVVNATANPVVTLGSAWELIHGQIPLVSGSGTSFDPDVLEAAREILAGLAIHAMYLSNGLETDIKKVNTKTDDFKGSAEAAWFHRVQDADRYLNDVPDQDKRWHTALLASSSVARDFVTAVQDANAKWAQIPPAGTWFNPYRVIAAMFNGSSLSFGTSNGSAWDQGTQYADTNGNGDSTPVVWYPPAWLNYRPMNAFDIGEWDALDGHLRQMWVNNVVNTFAPVLATAANLLSMLVDTRNKLTISDPVPLPPLPMPNDVGTPNGSGGGNGFPNFGNNFPNFGDNFPNFGDNFPNFGNSNLNLGGGGGGGLNNPFANDGTGGGGGLNNPFANDGTGGGGGLNNPFANGGDPNTLFSGAGNPFANSGGPGGVFANTPLGGGGGGLDNPFANSGNPGMFFSGAGNPFANGGGSGDGFLGSTDPFANSPQTLGDLTPAQLNELDKAGLLDNVPLTPQQAAFLRQNGLGLPGGDNPTLGQLSSGQLDALQHAGLLDQTPLTAAEQTMLGLPGISGTSNLPDLPLGPTNPVATNPFPTTVNGLDLPPVGHPGGGGLTLGNVSQPGAAAHPDIPNLHVGTGGLSSVPGITGSPGGLSHDGLGLTVGHGGAGAGGGTGGLGSVGGVGHGGAGAGTGGDAGAGTGGGNGLPGTNGTDGADGGDGDANGMGGMPYMPGMFGGGGGQNRQDRDRQRNTWLKEDEKVWGTDPECEPAVIGRRRKPTRVDDDDFPTTTPDERTNSPEEYRPYRRQ